MPVAMYELHDGMTNRQLSGGALTAAYFKSKKGLD